MANSAAVELCKSHRGPLPVLITLCQGTVVHCAPLRCCSPCTKLQTHALHLLLSLQAQATVLLPLNRCTDPHF